jgi:hypothetical protein
LPPADITIAAAAIGFATSPGCWETGGAEGFGFTIVRGTFGLAIITGIFPHLRLEQEAVVTDDARSSALQNCSA